MAYSMNWRPEQDMPPAASTSNAPTPSFGTGSPRPLGPIPGILPPSRQADGTNSFPPSTTKFSSSYSMNWKPPDMDEMPDSGAAADLQVQARPAKAEGRDVSSFCALLTPCPIVKLFSENAVSCEVDGTVCTMERDKLGEAWAIGPHPSRQPLTFSQSLSMLQAAVNCLYAIACNSPQDRTIPIRTPDRNEVHRDVYQVIQRLGLPSQTFKRSTLLQLHAYLDTAFLGPAIPATENDWNIIDSPRIRRGLLSAFSTTLYSRYSPALDAYVLFEPSVIDKSEGVRVYCKKDATSDDLFSIEVVIQKSKAIANLSLDNDGNIHTCDALITIIAPPTTSPSFLEACFVSLCHYAFLDDSRKSQLFFAVLHDDLEKMLKRYGARLAMYLSAKDLPKKITQTPVVYRLKATSFWDKVDML